MTLLARRSDGQTTAEYAFLLLLIALALIVSLAALGISTRHLYDGVVGASMS